MSEPILEERVSPPRRRWALRLLIAGLAVAVAALGVWFYLEYAWERDLRAACEEADRLDPGWRFANLDGARRAVSDDENSAPLVLKARGKIPAKWLAPPPGAGPGLLDRLVNLEPPRRPDKTDLQALRTELGKVGVGEALHLARGMADRPWGRYDVAWSDDLIGTLMPHVQETRMVAELLALDALLRACDGDGAGALRSCRAALNTGRSLGDEPAAISQILRSACGLRAVRALEQMLAQGEAPAPDLEALQQLLLTEAEEPLQLIAARSERAMLYQCFDRMRTGQFHEALYAVKPSILGSTGDDLLNRGRARAAEVAYLRYQNQLVEIAKLPPQDQRERLQALHRPAVDLPKLVEALSRDDDEMKLADLFHRYRAEMRCAAAALAAERYRLASGHWPERLEDLVPDYLPAVPADPFGGQPLRLRRLPDGLVVYSIGPDQQDDAGLLDRSHPGAVGSDVGFQLWDVGPRGGKVVPK